MNECVGLTWPEALVAVTFLFSVCVYCYICVTHE